MREFFDVDEEAFTDARPRLLLQRTTLTSKMDDRRFDLLMKFGPFLHEDG